MGFVLALRISAQPTVALAADRQGAALLDASPTSAQIAARSAPDSPGRRSDIFRSAE
jgi:hypothetical protein